MLASKEQARCRTHSMQVGEQGTSMLPCPPSAAWLDEAARHAHLARLVPQPPSAAAVHGAASRLQSAQEGHRRYMWAASRLHSALPLGVPAGCRLELPVCAACCEGVPTGGIPALVKGFLSTRPYSGKVDASTGFAVKAFLLE
eukprot:358495-Chlamydomonas_euryale.AAC.11